jgi:ribosomal protein S18 acetylase RimI-like enzyme
MEFRRLSKSDLTICFASRLRALENAPTAFLTTLAEEKERGLPFFERILSKENDDNVIFGAVSNNVVAGTIGIYREERPKTFHKSMIWGMYVDTDQRGKGIGGKLLDIAIEHAREKMKVATVSLSVESTNHGARKLYESRGFKVWGTEPKAMRSDGQYYDEDHMVLSF